jgi:hypothetical protein
MKKIFGVILSLIIVAAGLYSYFILGNQMRASRGLMKGGEYASKMYSDYAIVGKNCQGEDSNGDGYITCNFRLKSASNEKTITLQCPTFIKSFMATSCKEQGIVIGQ